ncbi:MAG: sulfurtransferase TusA family protein [Candidatus Thorarchaeota archaeon]|jgi:tRNA 2-thiouridine synthesizing protein A|nr:sulfurtransferase TusA family protein [Candidatus Thorarchaeota archaeon]
MSEMEPAESLDCVGLFCPQPLFQTREAIDRLKPGEVLEMISDDPAAEEDIKRFAKRTGNILLSFERLEDGVQRFLIRKKE